VDLIFISATKLYASTAVGGILSELAIPSSFDLTAENVRTFPRKKTAILGSRDLPAEAIVA